MKFSSTIRSLQKLKLVSKKAKRVFGELSGVL